MSFRQKSAAKTIVRWTIRAAIVVVALFAVHVTVLAFPQMFLSDSVSQGTVTIYYDADKSKIDVEALAHEVDQRLSGMELYDSGRNDRVFLFDSDNLYKFYARLSMVPLSAQGYGISLLGNSYINSERIEILGQSTGHLPRYSVWEGSLVHTIAHEVAHHYLIGEIGRAEWMNYPHWKQEGIPEYLANIGAIRSDSSASLTTRIGILTNDFIWDGRYDWNRIHYEAGLLVEYLKEIEGYSLKQIVADSISHDTVYDAMIAWSQSQSTTSY